MVLVILWAAGAALAERAEPAAEESPKVSAEESPPMPPGPPMPPAEGRRHESRREGAEEGPEGSRFRIPRLFRDVTDEEIGDILGFMKENMPWMHEEMEKLRQADPDRFRQVCRRLRFEIGQLRAMKERDPEGFRQALEAKRLKFHSGVLAAKVRAAQSPEEREQLAAKLRKTLERQFQLETAAQEAAIRRLEERIAAVRKELQERAARRKEILQQRLDQLMSEKADLETPGEPSQAPPPPEHQPTPQEHPAPPQKPQATPAE
jgi:hypothetical protein